MLIHDDSGIATSFLVDQEGTQIDFEADVVRLYDGVLCFFFQGNLVAAVKSWDNMMPRAR